MSMLKNPLTTHVLAQGDIIHWDGSYPHFCQNTTDVPAKVMLL